MKKLTQLICATAVVMAMSSATAVADGDPFYPGDPYDVVSTSDYFTQKACGQLSEGSPVSGGCGIHMSMAYTINLGGGVTHHCSFEGYDVNANVSGSGKIYLLPEVHKCSGGTSIPFEVRPCDGEQWVGTFFAFEGDPYMVIDTFCVETVLYPDAEVADAVMHTVSEDAPGELDLTGIGSTNGIIDVEAAFTYLRIAY